jgi:uncharacterized protein
MMHDDRIAALLDHAERVLERLDRFLPAGSREPPWEASAAFRWLGAAHATPLKAIAHPHRIALADLRCVDLQKAELQRNTQQFLAGLPANNVLLWGSRGTGKSSLIKALLHEYARDGLRLIEVDKAQLTELPDIVELIEQRSERFILFTDDLSFDADEASYKTLKAVLDGSLSALSGNALIYATSNRRHLMPEYLGENLEARNVDGEIHHGESVEEKISLSERFGVWLSFYPFTQDDYLEVVGYWLDRLESPKTDWPRIRTEALRWALKRGSRSGRVAWQFARDWTGRSRLPPD